jgi:RNA polymerase-binding transcription factor DksA
MAKKADKKSVKKPVVKSSPKSTKKEKPVKKVAKIAKAVKAKEVKVKAKKVEKKPVKRIEKKVVKATVKAPTKHATVKTVKKGIHVEVISPSKKVKKIQGYSKKELEEFKKVIMEKRTEIIEQLQTLKEQMMDPTTGQYVNESSPYSLHMAEQGTDAMEREKLYLWAQRENKFLGYLDDALQRIDNGTYGICIECIDEPQHLCATCPLIPKERLMAVPHTQHCLQVKQKMK